MAADRVTVKTANAAGAANPSAGAVPGRRGLLGGKDPAGRLRDLSPLPVTADEAVVDPGRIRVPGEQSLCGTEPVRGLDQGWADRPPYAGVQGLWHHPVRFMVATEQVSDRVLQHRE